MPSAHTSSRRSVHQMGHRRSAWRRRPPRTPENNSAQPHAAARISGTPKADRETESRRRASQGICFRDFRRRCGALQMEASQLRLTTMRIQRILPFPLVAAKMPAMAAPTKTGVHEPSAGHSASCIYDRHPYFTQSPMRMEQRMKSNFFPRFCHRAASWVGNDQAFAMMLGSGSIEWARSVPHWKVRLCGSDLALCDRHDGEWVGLMTVTHLQLGISDRH